MDLVDNQSKLFPDVVNNSKNLSEVSKQKKNDVIQILLDKEYLHDFFHRIYENDIPNYKEFNDIEMIYLYIHQEKDQDEEKNTKNNTKKEYLRELINAYLLFKDYPDYFQFSVPHGGSIFKHLNEKQILLYQQWLKTAPLGKGNKPYSIATISRKTIVLKSFLLFLYRKEYISRPIHQSFIPAKVSQKDRPHRDISRGEVIQLLDYYKHHPIMHCFLSVLITTGARIEELCTAKVSGLSYEWNEKASKFQYWLEVTGKGDKVRPLLIHDNVFETIVKFRKRRGLETNLNPTDHSPLFVTAKGIAYKPKNLSMYISKHIHNANVPFIQINNQLKEQAKNGVLPENEKHKIRSITPHTLRHGFAIISAENDSDIYRIMQSLGHEKIETTMIYLESKQSKDKHVGHTWEGNDILNHI